MQNYDFQILQPNEFERLVRDLLQNKENVFVESFTQGRDDGIDLRYANCQGTKVIVQAKRYSSYTSLKSELKKEVEKIKKLNPTRYIIVTSVGMTPANKDEIIKSCYPFIKFLLSADAVFRRLGFSHLGTLRQCVFRFNTHRTGQTVGSFAGAAIILFGSII